MGPIAIGGYRLVNTMVFIVIVLGEYQLYYHLRTNLILNAYQGKDNQDLQLARRLRKPLVHQERPQIRSAFKPLGVNL